MPPADSLMGALRRTALHYIRCIKPNDSMAALAFDQQRVLEQLHCAGLIEVVRLRQLGYPSRMPFSGYYPFGYCP